MASAPFEVPTPTPAAAGVRTTTLALYSPDLPPVRGGVADHTLLLARALVAAGARVAVLGLEGEPERFRPVPVLTGVTPSGRGHGLAESARQIGAGAVLVQYVPFLFARFGLAPSLVAALGDLRRAGVRVGLFVHEPYVPFTRPVWWLTGPPMRWQFRALVRRADVVFAAVPTFLERARRVARPATRLVPAPVGATIQAAAFSRAEARAALGLAETEIAVGVFSPRASGARPEWLAHAGAALAPAGVRWVFFGAGSDQRPAGFPAEARARCLGWLDPADTSRVFRALDVAAAPFEDGLTLRRTSAMAALAHGVPLVSSRGPLFDGSLEAAAVCATSPAEFAAAIGRLAANPAARAAQGRSGLEWYEARGSIDVLARLVRAELATP